MRRLLFLGTLGLASLGVLLTACAEESSSKPTATQAAVTATRTEAPRPNPTSAATEKPASSTPAPSNGTAQVVYRAETDLRAIALTFNAGSDVGFTSDILRILREQNVRATFAITGVWAEQNRDLLFAIAADGHTIMNHTYDHPSFTGNATGQPPLTSDDRALQLARAERTVYRYTSRSTKPYFRPPYGDIDNSVRHDVATEGYDTIVMWSIDTNGWNGASAPEIVARVESRAEPGGIIIMNVGSASQDAAALPDVIAQLQADGYELLPINELLALEAE